jgi:hypothetical protein
MMQLLLMTLSIIKSGNIMNAKGLVPGTNLKMLMMEAMSWGRRAMAIARIESLKV